MTHHSSLFRFRLMPTLPLIVAALIFYACCLIPVNRVPGISFFEHFDKVVHFVMYLTLSTAILLAYRYAPHRHMLPCPTWLYALVIPILYGGAIELIQRYFCPGRQGDWLDLLADALGALTAFLVGVMLRRKRR